MADGIEFEIQGLEGLQEKLMQLSLDVRKRGGRSSLQKAAAFVRDAAKVNAKKIDDPVSNADISANIIAQWDGRYFKRTGDMKFRVGVMGGAGGNKKAAEFESLPGKDTRHWRQLEFGNQNHPAQPFMRRSLAENVQSATNVFVSEYRKAIDKAIARGSRVPKAKRRKKA